MFGDRPYSSTMAVENPLISMFSYGEGKDFLHRPRHQLIILVFLGYHNYHHTFPSDYLASEIGHGFNLARHFIDLMFWLGHASNLKTMSDTSVKNSKQKQTELAKKSMQYVNNWKFVNSHEMVYLILFMSTACIAYRIIQ